MNTRTLFGRVAIGAVLLVGIGIGWALRGPGPGDGAASGTEAALRSAEGVASETAEVMEWTCSMHPQIRSHEPGLCPICAMDLIPVDTGADDGPGPVLTLSPTARKLASVQTTAVRRAPAYRELRLTGVLRADETREREISAWIGGRVEKLHVDFTGRPVRKGQALLDLYSPELYAAQEELLQSVRSRQDLGRGSDLLARNEAAARERLRLWGLESAQIDEIVRRGTAEAVVTIPSPIAGIVLAKPVQAGQTVRAGQTLYKIADLSRLWLELEAYESDLPWLAIGDEVAFGTDAHPGEEFRGKVVFVDPVAQPETRTIRVRVEIPNEAGRLKPAMYARAELHASVAGEDGRDPLVIPETAPLLTGERAVVYVADPDEEGRFEGREIVLGPKAGAVYVVRSGLAEGERVVSRGAFKIDSALQIRARKSMMNPGTDADAAASGNGPRGMDATGSGPEPIRRLDVPVTFRRALEPTLAAYFEISESLSLDDVDAAQSAAARLSTVVSAVRGDGLEVGAHSRWMERRAEVLRRAGELAAAKGLDAARIPFEPLSVSMIAVVRELGASGADSVYVYHCPMAFQDKGAEWLQRRRGVENPYFGSKMFRCGSETERLVP